MFKILSILMSLNKNTPIKNKSQFSVKKLAVCWVLDIIVQIASFEILLAIIGFCEAC